MNHNLIFVGNRLGAPELQVNQLVIEKCYIDEEMAITPTAIVNSVSIEKNMAEGLPNGVVVNNVVLEKSMVGPAGDGIILNSVALEKNYINPGPAIASINSVNLEKVLIGSFSYYTIEIKSIGIEKVFS